MSKPNASEASDGEGKQEILLKVEPQLKRELDGAMEQLTKQVAKGGGIAFIGRVIGKVATFGLHILLGGVLRPRTGKVAPPPLQG